MTKNSFSKSAIRARMEETGEPYSVAARALADSTVEEPTATVVSSSSPVKGVADYGALIVFCERLALFSNMGHNFENAMKLIAPHTTEPVLSEALDFILTTRKRGTTGSEPYLDLADLMALRPNAFRGVFPEVVRIASSSGSTEGIRAMAQLYRTESQMGF